MTPKQVLPGSAGGISVRKPYQRLAIVAREPLEVLAALWSPSSGGKAVQPVCNPTKS